MALRLLSLLAACALFVACGGDDDPSSSASVAPTGDQLATVSPSPAMSGSQATAGTLPRGWTQLAPLPTPRSEVAVAAVEGLIYVVGGFEASGTPSQQVEVYAPATDTWSAAPPLPRPRHHTAAIELEGDLLVVGGYQGGFGDPQVTVYRFDPETQTWTEGPPLNVARGGHAVAHVNGTPVVVGGADDAGVSLASAEWLDSASETWRLFDHELSVPRDHLAAAAVPAPDGDGSSDEVYAIGGRSDVDFSRNQDATESSIAFGPWGSRPSLPTLRSGIAAATLEGRIYVFGGEGPEGAFDTVEVYDPDSETWSAASAMPTARHGLGAAVVDGAIYVIGGGPTPGLSVTAANEVLRP